MPTPPAHIKLIQYADDISIYASGPVIRNLCKAINTYTKDVVAYLKSRELQLSAEKSTVTPKSHPGKGAQDPWSLFQLYAHLQHPYL